MIPKETEAKILRLYVVEKWKKNTIARELGLHHSVIARVIKNSEAPEPEAAEQARGSAVKPPMITPFIGFIEETMGEFPKIAASRLYRMVKERGYGGGPDHFRHEVRRLRPRRAREAYLRVNTLAGEEAQMDWAHFGRIRIGNANRQLMAFLMVLSYSRRLFVRFYPGQSMEYFLRGHVEAFHAFGSVPRRVLYDNLKSAVLARQGGAIHFNPKLLALAAHYRYDPRPVGVRRGNEKGRVERAVRYLRGSCFEALKWDTLDELNEKVDHFCNVESMERPWPDDRTKTVAAAFEEERQLLLALPRTPYVSCARVEVKIGKTPYARFDGNDYSVPHRLVRQILCVVATMKTVRVLDGPIEVARHARSFDKGKRIEDVDHLRELVEHKRHARKGYALDLVQRAAPKTAELLKKMAERGKNIGSATFALKRLLEDYGARDLVHGIEVALEKKAYHPHAVRYAIETKREKAAGQPVLPVPLPDDSRVRITVIPHELKNYDMENDDGR